MTMSIPYSHNLLLASTLLLTLLLPASCAGKSPPPSSPQGLLMEDKIRLGSTPPSCHNRCNQCNPCTAVQVPTLPARPDRAGSGPTGRTALPLDNDRPAGYGKYSNYKPLGWKCRCGDQLYNP